MAPLASGTGSGRGTTIGVLLLELIKCRRGWVVLSLTRPSMAELVAGQVTIAGTQPPGQGTLATEMRGVISTAHVSITGIVECNLRGHC